MRTCAKCGGTKPLDEFYLQSSGHRRTDCKTCCAAYAKGRPAQAYDSTAEKQCSRCLAHKNNAEFSRCKNGRFGTRSWCKPCFNAYAKVDNKKRYDAAPEAALLRFSKWANSNQSRVLAKNRANRARSPQTYRASRMLRYEREISASGVGVSPADWLEILEIHDNRCAYCLRKTARLQLDHVIALTRGGEHSPNNVVPACRSCNASKKDKAMFELFNLRLLVAQRSA